jgi:hypothetical protein
MVASLFSPIATTAWCHALAKVVEYLPPHHLRRLSQSLEGVVLQILDDQGVDCARLGARCADVPPCALALRQ